MRRVADRAQKVYCWEHLEFVGGSMHMLNRLRLPLHHTIYRVCASHDKLYLFVVSTYIYYTHSQRDPCAIIRILKWRRLRLRVVSGGVIYFQRVYRRRVWYQNKTEIALSGRTPAKLPQQRRRGPSIHDIMVTIQTTFIFEKSKQRNSVNKSEGLSSFRCSTLVQIKLYILQLYSNQ